MNEKLNFNVFFFKNGIFFENCPDCTDFLKKMYGFFKKCTDCTYFFFKIVRIVRIFFRKLHGLYGFLLKMYGFLYGFVQKSFGHPELLKISKLPSVNAVFIRSSLL